MEYKLQYCSVKSSSLQYKVAESTSKLYFSAILRWIHLVTIQHWQWNRMEQNWIQIIQENDYLTSTNYIVCTTRWAWFWSWVSSRSARPGDVSGWGPQSRAAESRTSESWGHMGGKLWRFQVSQSNNALHSLDIKPLAPPCCFQNAFSMSAWLQLGD